MLTAVLTPREIFNLPQHLVIPLFQRRYVWNEENQWTPLWNDVRRVTDLRLQNPAGGASHFLGAVVLQAQPNQTGTLQQRLVIDGQQRLTTLQILMDACAAVFETVGQENAVRQLEELTHNPSYHVTDEPNRLKLRHTNQDRVEYDDVMEADPPVDYASLTAPSGLLAQAHKFFAEQVREWLESSADDLSRRSDALTAAITQQLSLVVIDLKADENSQEIFETLNARGTPLTATDLIKNFVFQSVSAHGGNAEETYANDWPFEAPFWEKEVSSGRYNLVRSALFLSQWLTSRTGEEISPRQTFARFKHFAEHETDSPMSELVRVLKAQGDAYEAWTRAAEDPHATLSRVEMSFYRLQASDLELLKPIYIWLHEPGLEYSPATIDSIVSTVESWVFRRALLRLPTADLGRVVADLIGSHRGVPDSELAEAVARFVSDLNVASTYWPGDAELRASLIETPAYRRFRRGRLRVFLEAAEDHLRGYNDGKATASARVSRGIHQIEHLLPQSWEKHWKVKGPEKIQARNEHVHRLGNLTLLTGKLNSGISNGPWLGKSGKRKKLHDHDVFILNRRIEDMSANGWDEDLIDDRTKSLVDALIATWPVPAGHTGTIKEPAASAGPNVSFKQIFAAGLIEPGTKLKPKPGAWGDVQAEVLPTGKISVAGQEFTSPSGAGHHLRQGSTNGWQFWSLPDGTRLAEIRSAFIKANTGVATESVTSANPPAEVEIASTQKGGHA